MSINTDEPFDGVLIAVGAQTAFGTPHAGVSALNGTGPYDETDGFILGDRDSGDAESGVTLPTLESVVRNVQAVPGSFTEQADSFQKFGVTGFRVSFALIGNGDTAGAPDVGDADLATLLPGLEAILETMGLIGADATAPIEEYTPRHSGSSGGATIYSTWRVWHGDLQMLFSDCLIETAEFVFTPGGNCIVTCDVQVGTIDDTQTFDRDAAFPTVTFGPFTDLVAPVCEGVAFLWGQQHGFVDLTITIRNTIEEYGDSNVDTTGVRKTQTAREIAVTGTLYVETTDSDFHVQNLRDATPTDNLSFQMGTPAGAGETINAFKFEVNGLQSKSLKYNRVGTAMVVELQDSKATAAAAGGEFKLSMN